MNKNNDRKNHNKRALLTIFVFLQMLLTPAAAGISTWIGPPTMGATPGNDDTVDGWEVASNATILDGWFDVNEAGGLSDGNGIGWIADQPSQNFTSSGKLYRPIKSFFSISQNPSLYYLYRTIKK